MTDSELPPLPEPRLGGRRAWLPALIWVLPVLAALFGISLVVAALRERGPAITLSFANAAGLEPGKTKVKFKDVDIGTVREIGLSQDRGRVEVVVDLKKQAAAFAADDSRFWVVRPRLVGTSVSGLDTLLSGSYIAVDGGHSEQRRNRFVGLEEPPPVASDIPGRRFTLHADEIGSLDIGSPVYYRHIPVGQVESYRVEDDGRAIDLGVFVRAPYDRFVTISSRFWHASGVDLRLDADGLKLETQSLATILLGGVAFETPADAASPAAAAEGAAFSLAADHSSAIKLPDGAPQTILLHFHQSVRGLSPGAPVDFRGVNLGQVRSIRIASENATGDMYPEVLIDTYPERIGAPVAASDAPMIQSVRKARLAELVRRGMRAQLRSGSLLTGQLYVAIDFFPRAVAVGFDPESIPLEFPTVPSELEALQQQLENILAKLDKIPFDTLGQDAHRALVSLDDTLKHLDTLEQHADSQLLPAMRDSLASLQRSTAAIEAVLASDAPLQQDVRQALRGMLDAARSLRALSDSLERQPEALIRGKGDNPP